MTDASNGGTYTLLIAVSEPRTLEVGALGESEFESGWYAYTGSALGPGGFARVERHRELAAGERDVRHWHIDHLLGAAEATIDVVARSPGVDAECAIAQSIPGDAVPGFGSSDCACHSHLAYSPRRAPLAEAVREAHRAHGTETVVETADG